MTLDGNEMNFEGNAMSEEVFSVERKKSRKKIIGLAAGAVILVFGGLFAAFALRSGSGAQPESVLPRDTVAFAKLDFNPAFSQKINLVRFFSKFPTMADDFDQKDPIGSVFELLAGTTDIQWSEIKPWIGDRYAIAGVQTADGIEMVLVLAIKSESEMKYYFAKRQPELLYVMRDGYAVIAESKATLRLITSAPTHLSDNPEYVSDVKALQGDQVAVAWIDMKPVLGSASESINSALSEYGFESESSSIDKISGRVVVGFHFTPNQFVSTLLTRGIADSKGKPPAKIESMVNLGDLPKSTMAAIGFTGLSTGISQAIDGYSVIQEFLDSVQISLTDVNSLFDGSVDIFALQGQKASDAPVFGLRLSPSDIEKARTTLIRVLLDNGLTKTDINSMLIAQSDHLYLAFDDTSLKTITAKSKAGQALLEDTQMFKESNSGRGFFSAFVSLSKLLPSLGNTSDIRPLDGVGFSTENDSGLNGSTRTILTATLNKE